MIDKPLLPPGSKLVLATHNEGKFQEFASMMRDLPLTLIPLSRYKETQPEETATTFAGNAEIKAKAAAQATGLPALADDSGLCVDALDGAPGIYSARWAGPDRNFRKAMEDIITKIQGKPRTGHFNCTLALVVPGQSKSFIFEGTMKGNLSWPPRGGHGHGYDSFFQPEGCDQTFAEMSDDEKNRISPRSQALEKLFKFLPSQKNS